MEVLQSNLDLRIDSDRSIDELIALSDEGTSVMRTCHLGNLSAHNMALLDAGIPAWLVDYMRTGSDSDYLPEAVMVAGQAMSLDVTAGTVVSRTLTGEGSRLDDLHAESIRSAFPSARIETANEYANRHAAIAREVIEITGAASVDRDSSVSSVDSYDIGTKGMLLITFIAEALETQETEQFHLGGSKLHQYIAKLMPDIDEGIGLLRQHSSFGGDIPDIRVNIVPTEHAVFATSMDRRVELDGMVEAVTRFFESSEELVESRRRFFKEGRTKEERETFISDVNKKKQRHHDNLRSATEEFGQVIEDRSSGSWTTQYDVIESGGLYTHPINRQLTMSELQKLHQAIIKAKRQITAG